MSAVIAEELVLDGIARATVELLSRQELVDLVLELDRRNRKAWWAAKVMTGSHVFDMPRIMQILSGKGQN